MRIILGLAALAATVNAQTVQWSGNPSGNNPISPPVGQTSLATIVVTQQVAGGANTVATPTIGGGYLNSNNWVLSVANTVTAVNFQFVTNQYTGQMQYRWNPNYTNVPSLYPGNSFSLQSYTCDMCAGGTPVTCNTAVGPGGVVTNPAKNTPQTGYPCSSLLRNYLFQSIQPSTQTQQVVNSFSMQLFDINTNPAPNVSSYSFQLVRAAPPLIIGDPQIVGMQGQDFQVHGIPDEIFNMVSYPSLQVNARFTYLESAECVDNYTACFAHPGTYISEEGFRVGKDKVRVTAGTAKKGLTVSVNGKKTTSNVDLRQGAIEVVNHRRVIVHTNVMKITVTNSDKFLNQELELNDDKLLALGNKRRSLKDNERFHAEVPLHGLQGQTWRNVEYPSGLDYEGSITDYHVVDGNLFGTDFVFNQFQA